MNSKYVEVIAVSTPKDELDCLLTRVVLWKSTTAPKGRQYITHLEVSTQPEPYFIWGHYDMSQMEALDDFIKRCTMLGVELDESSLNKSDKAD